MILVNKRLTYPRGLVGNNIYMFTANSVVNGSGKLVMGRGCAKTVRDTYLGVDKLFGDVIDNMMLFGVRFVKHKFQWIGAFQTKYNWQDPSPLELVEYSVFKLAKITGLRPEYTFHLPFPAISNGGQSVGDVLPLLQCLPDNVIVYLDK